MKHIISASVLLSVVLLQGCVGQLIGQTSDVAIETAKVPFKVGQAVTGSDKDD